MLFCTKLSGEGYQQGCNGGVEKEVLIGRNSLGYAMLLVEQGQEVGKGGGSGESFFGEGVRAVRWRPSTQCYLLLCRNLMSAHVRVFPSSRSMPLDTIM